jgi:probable rRNA maturation factor
MSVSPAPPSLTVDVVIESPAWDAHGDVEETVHHALAQAAETAGEGGEVAVLLTDDAAIKALNLRWRGKDAATNVLSFPAAPLPPGMPRNLGDIAVAYETMAQEAKGEEKPFEHHLVHLVVHGFLHLLGYDHEAEDDADDMERLERDILARLDVPDPYAARDAEV